MGARVGVFHFQSLTSPTHFHLNQQLLALGWINSPEGPRFSERNINIKNEYSTLLEYKHQLGEIITTHCPDISPVTMTINDTNYANIYQSICEKNDGNAWILKPSLLNNGVGIKLLGSPEEVLSHYASSNRYSGEHVLQAYIHPPHLLNGHKYSIRMFVIINSDKSVYLYREGYFNICRAPYEKNDLTRLHAHLTNEHLERSRAEPNNYQIPTKQCETFSPVYEDIKAILQCFFQAYRLYLTDNICQLSDNRSFIILGADFMLDESLKTYLIEYNHGACFPISETHPLYKTLYQPFFKQLVSQFVIPIALEEPIINLPTSAFEKIC